MIRFGYKVLRVADGVLLCEGTTVHVVVGKDMKKCPLPRKYAERFAAYLHQMGGSQSGSQAD